MERNDVKVRLRKSRMVGDVPMDVIYRGMSRERLDRINKIENEAWNAADDLYDQMYEQFDYRLWAQVFDQEFRRRLDRAAVKAAWNRNNKRKVTK